MEYLRISGGIFHDMLCHDFDMVHMLSGQFPVSAYSAAHTYNEQLRELGDADMVVVTLKFASGLIANVDTSRIAPYGYDQRIEVLGSKGMCMADNVLESAVTVATEAGFVGPRNTHSFPQRYEQTYHIELLEFVELVAKRQPEPEATVRRHVMLEKVTTAAELSFRLGREVRVDEVETLRATVPPSLMHGPSSKAAK